MKILVLGWYYSPNLGDAVLTECTAALLRRAYPQATVVIRDLIGRQATPPAGKTSPLRSRLFRLFTRLDRFGYYVNRHKADLDRVAAGDWDAVVFAGGQIFMDSLAIYVSYLTEVFARRQIPVFFQACGMGPSWNQPVRQRLGQALCLDNVKYCSCRDDVARLNRRCGRSVAVSAADSALWADEIFGITAKPGNGVLGLGIMDASNLPSRRVLAFWQDLIRALERRSISWRLFTNGSCADMAFARRLLQSLPELKGPAERYLCPAPEKQEDLVTLIAGFDSLISFRLHSHIIAAALDIPTVAVVWDDKLQFFFDSIGHPERCLPMGAAPDRVLQTLERARHTGYDRAWLQNLREGSARQLLDAMAPYLNREDAL